MEKTYLTLCVIVGFLVGYVGCDNDPTGYVPPPVSDLSYENERWSDLDAGIDAASDIDAAVDAGCDDDDD